MQELMLSSFSFLKVWDLELGIARCLNAGNPSGRGEYRVLGCICICVYVYIYIYTHN